MNIQCKSLSRRDLHNVCLVDGGDTVTTDRLGVSKSIASNTLGGFLGDELDGLNNTIDDLTFWKISSTRSAKYSPSSNESLPRVRYQSIHPQCSHG